MNKAKLLKSVLIPTLGISIIGTIAAISTSCGEKKPTVIHVTSVSLNKTSTTLDISSTEQLTATVSPEDATDKSVTWASSDTNIASVDSNGKITAIAKGTATITVKTNDGGKTATCAVTVNDKVVPVTGVTLNKTTATLAVGDTVTLTATVSPEDATDKSATWTSSRPSVATVDNNGKITAVAEGTATITVKTNDGGKTATCAVTVNDKVIPVTSVSLNKTSTTLDVGKTETLTAIVSPADATDKSVTWTSDNKSVATVDNNGKITAVAEGTATITVKTNDGGKTATCAVTVNDKVIPVTSVSLNKTSTTLDVGKTETLTATVSPEDATDKSVTWASSDTNIASVDSNGKITAIAKGTATITVKTNDGGKTATCAVTVNDVIPVTSVSLNKTSTTLDIGSTEQLTAIVSPEDATDKSVTWASSDTNIASVDSNGKITAVAQGTATIVVATHDGGKTATCAVTVNDKVIPVTSVSLNKTSTTLAVGGTETLTATVLPEDATDKSVTWTSSDTNIASIDSNGKITAVAQGTATIVVTTHDGGKTATCAVTVNEGFINIHIKSGNNGSVSKTDVFVGKGSTFGQIKSELFPQPNPQFVVCAWTLVDESGGYISEITDNYKFEDNVNLKVLFNRVDNPKVIATQESKWGDITVRYKLLDNHECRLLTKYEGADDEDGYVSGGGTIIIPDHVIYGNKEPYYIRQIPSDWSDGENNITGLLFDHVKHLETICNRAFYHTCALDCYTSGHDWEYSYCSFPEGLKTIGDKAFCGTSYSKEDYITGYSFPSTLESIGEMAFQYSPYIGLDSNLYGTLIFRSEVTIGEDAFWNTYDHYLRYVYAPSMSLAQQMVDILKATGDFNNDVMEPV